MCFNVSHDRIRMGMFELDWIWKNAVKSAGNGFLTRGNRFLYGQEPGSALKIDEKLKNCTQEPVPVRVGTGFPYIFPEACF